jgi:hypothetical protein
MASTLDWPRLPIADAPFPFRVRWLPCHDPCLDDGPRHRRPPVLLY